MSKASLFSACRPIVHGQVQYPGRDEQKCESTVCGEPYVICSGTSKTPVYSVEQWATVLQRMSSTGLQTAEEWGPFTSQSLSTIDV